MHMSRLAERILIAGFLINLALPVMASDWKSHLMSGDQNLGNARYTSALREYDLALEKNPNAWEVYLHKAKVYEKLGRQADVIAAYDQAMQLHPRQERVWMERSDYFIRRNMPDQARYDIEEGLRYLPYSPGLRYTRALYLLKYENDMAQVLEDLNMATQVRPDWIQAHILKAKLHRQLNQWPAYEQDLGMLIQYEPKNPAWYSERSQTRIHLASLYQAQQQTEMQAKVIEGALMDIETLVAMEPQNPTARLIRGRLYLFKGDRCKKALIDLKMACKMGMKDACYKKPPCEVPQPIATPTPEASGTATGTTANTPAPASSPAPVTPQASTAPTASSPTTGAPATGK